MTHRGFTLVEVLVAIAIVGLVSVATLAAVGAGARAADRAAVAIVASELAEERLASLLTLSPAALADSTDGVQRDVFGMPGWTWTATAAPRGDRLTLLGVRVESRHGSAERRLLRPEIRP